tara:strand:+ start:322 stop:498 length:177 start_codon:yes stop_codon:yes gene_type:complete
MILINQVDQVEFLVLQMLLDYKLLLHHHLIHLIHQLLLVRLRFYLIHRQLLLNKNLLN